MLCYAATTVFCQRMKHGVEQIWWQDREIMTLSYWRHDRLYRHYVVHHPKTGYRWGLSGGGMGTLAVRIWTN